MGITTRIARERRFSKLLLFTETGINSCNMACKYCFLGKEGTNKKMSINVLHRAIDFLNLYATSTPSIHFFGTEPLKNWSMIQEARKYSNMLISLTTNGLALTRDRIKWMDDNNIKLYVFSIDGGREHSINRVLKNGDYSWDIVSKNAKLVLESKQRKWITARGTWTGHDYDLVGRFEALDKGLGFPSIQIVPDVVGPFKREKVKQAYLELGEYYNWGTTPSRFVNEMVQKLVNEELSIQEGNMCGVGNSTWAVLPDGTLTLCQLYTEDKIGVIGNIWDGITNEMPFMAISDRVDTFHTDINPYPLERCKTCTAYKHCQGVGWCAGINRLSTGDELVAPRGYCEHLVGMVDACRLWADKRRKQLPPTKVGILGRTYDRSW